MLVAEEPVAPEDGGFPPARPGNHAGSGGGIGADAHGARAATTSAGVWYRSAGDFFIIFATTAAIVAGTSVNGSGSRN